VVFLVASHGLEMHNIKNEFVFLIYEKMIFIIVLFVSLFHRVLDYFMWDIIQQNTLLIIQRTE